MRSQTRLSTTKITTTHLASLKTSWSLLSENASWFASKCTRQKLTTTCIWRKSNQLKNSAICYITAKFLRYIADVKPIWRSSLLSTDHMYSSYLIYITHDNFLRTFVLQCLPGCRPFTTSHYEYGFGAEITNYWLEQR